MPTPVEIKGLDQLQLRLEMTYQRVDSESRALVTKMAALTKQIMQQKANTGQHAIGQGHIPGTGPGPNKVTGNLIASIKTKRTLSGGHGDYMAVVGPTADYAPYLEYGHNAVRNKRGTVVGRGSVQRKFGRRLSGPEGGNPGQYPFVGPAIAEAEKALPELLRETGAKIMRK